MRSIRFSMANNSKTKIIDTLIKFAMIIILALWARVDLRLSRLEDRIRSLELQTTAISIRLGIELENPERSSQAIPGRTGSLRMDESKPAEE